MTVDKITRREDGQMLVTVTLDDAREVVVECKPSEVTTYTKLQSALLCRAGILWRDDAVEYARPRERRGEYLILLEEALAAGRQAS